MKEAFIYTLSGVVVGFVLRLIYYWWQDWREWKQFEKKLERQHKREVELIMLLALLPFYLLAKNIANKNRATGSSNEENDTATGK